MSTKTKRTLLLAAFFAFPVWLFCALILGVIWSITGLSLIAEFHAPSDFVVMTAWSSFASTAAAGFWVLD